MLMRETWVVIHDQCQDYDTSSFPITIGHDVNCYDHATGARTMWGNRVIETERKAERERKRERMAERESTRIPPSRSSMSDLIGRVREPMKGNGTRPLLQAFTVVAIAGRLTLGAVGERGLKGFAGERYRVVEACRGGRFVWWRSVVEM